MDIIIEPNIGFTVQVVVNKVILSSSFDGLVWSSVEMLESILLSGALNSHCPGKTGSA